ncbi:hypothetical protein GUJ93_ZPchr1545g22263 [Zizania palustris]|uniref:Uncharacterized protein n=1 Tax=Zizania palustris TaxID=103762 RepID=A0A8J5USY2_ZIZPA|nr:hypothetical protein GUJ93_ZPchr1545g22263 [Zizania palustris]
MACINSAQRAALTTLAPEAPYLTAGTMSGAVDMLFSASANIEIFGLDFQFDSLDLPLLASAPSADHFNRLSWSVDWSLVSSLRIGSPQGLTKGSFASRILRIPMSQSCFHHSRVVNVFAMPQSGTGVSVEAVDGHDHCLEHISSRDSPIQYFTSGGGSKAWRGVFQPNDDKLQFFYDGQGFMSLQPFTYITEE